MEKRRAYSKEYSKRNPDKVAAKEARRRALKLNATPKWSDKDEILKFYEASRRLSELLGEWYHVDHIVPLVSDIVCGLHCEANLQILIGKDNLSKGNRYWLDMPD